MPTQHIELLVHSHTLSKNPSRHSDNVIGVLSRVSAMTIPTTLPLGAILVLLDDQPTKKNEEKPCKQGVETMFHASLYWFCWNRPILSSNIFTFVHAFCYGSWNGFCGSLFHTFAFMLRSHQGQSCVRLRFLNLNVCFLL